jgi:hypothetical protein
MEKNDIVEIYQNPIEKENYEGRAMLLKRIYKLGNLERWVVRFLDFSEFALCRRNIYVPTLLLALFFATKHKNSYQTLNVSK